MTSITREDIADSVAKQAGITEKTARLAVATVLNVISSALAEGTHVELRGFGSFTVNQIAANEAGRNPKTGEQIAIPARRRIKFKPGKDLKTVMKTTE
jgi:integration host factor subunit beta